MDDAKKEIVTHLTKELTEEISGVESYFNYAEMAHKLGDSYLERGLCEIAKDEYTHAKFIHDYLVDAGATITTEQETKWMLAKDRVMHKFHRK